MGLLDILAGQAEQSRSLVCTKDAVLEQLDILSSTYRQASQCTVYHMELTLVDGGFTLNVQGYAKIRDHLPTAEGLEAEERERKEAEAREAARNQ